MNDQTMQWGPYPVVLHDLVKRVHLEPGWIVRLTDETFQRDEDHGRGAAGGITLIITARVKDTYHPEKDIYINHYFPVPGATYNEQSWMRWLFDCYTKVRLHECMEYFQIVASCDCMHAVDPELYEHEDGCASEQQPNRPYAPNHGPGEDVYTVRELTTDEARRTQYTGNIDHK